MGKPIDLTGMKFGRLTVIEFAEQRRSKGGSSKRYWKCECNCKEKTIVYHSTQNLIKGHALSCGCYKKEVASKSNVYDLNGSFGIGYTSNGKAFYFDLEDYEKIKEYCWCFNSKGYLHANSKMGDNSDVLLHRLVTNCPDGLMPDHIGGELSRFDNRKSNLRISTSIENAQNKPLKKNNKSGFTGVSWSKSNQKWIASIQVNKNKIYLGSFKLKEDAIKARKIAEDKYFGEYSYDNSQKLYKQVSA